MKMQKDGRIIGIRDRAQYEAFRNSGWNVVEEADDAPAPDLGSEDDNDEIPEP